MKVIIQKDREVVSWPVKRHTMYKEIWICTINCVINSIYVKYINNIKVVTGGNIWYKNRRIILYVNESKDTRK